MKKYPQTVIQEVLRVFETEGINAAHERYNISKNTIYRWKGQADMNGFFDGGKEKVEPEQGQAALPAEPAEAPGEAAATSEQEPASAPVTAPESPAAPEADDQPEAAPEAPGEAVSAPESPGGIAAPPAAQRSKESNFVESAILAAHSLLYGVTGQGNDAMVFIIKENERLRRENDQLRRAIKVMVDVT